MAFLSLPTDNLYKFLFWLGILLIALSFYHKQKTTNEHYDNLYKLDSMMISLKSDEAALKTYLSFIEEESTVRSRKRTFEVKQELETKHARINNYLAKEKRLSQKFEANKETLKTAYLIGLIAFSIGGLAWLFKVQIPQERMVAVQHKLLEIELQEKQSPSYPIKHFRPAITPFVKRSNKK
jgi:hypothetical protein